MRRRVLGSGPSLLSSLIVLLTLWPAASWATGGAADVCAHPLSGGWVCARTFAVISIVYALIASSYGVGALLIGKPRLLPGRFRAGLLLVPLVSWLGAMTGFSIGGVLGLLHYAHDSSPFFFLDWFTLGVTFIVTTLAVLLLYSKRLAT